jgi:hypothetical protein
MPPTVGVQAFPLQWPPGRPRTPANQRERSKFKVPGIGTARDELLREVRLMGGRHAVISSNLRIKGDGLPYADQRQPDDAGVAVYYTDRKGRQKCFACDRWRKVEENMRAVAKAIEALRGIARWGTGEMVEAAFTGFSALPPATVTQRRWHEVLGLPPASTRDQVAEAYRRLSLERHPDRGGTTEQQAELNAAVDAFDRESRS